MMQTVFQLQPESPKAYFGFSVSERADWLTLSFDYHKKVTWLQLNVRDPQGKLRYTHFDVYAPRSAVLHRDPALTSDLAIPGEIIPGEWKVEFIRKDRVPDSFTLNYEYGEGALPEDIVPPSHGHRFWWTDGTAAGDFALNLYDWSQCLREGKHWYKGELHSHTTLSDGKTSTEGQMAQAREAGLDFILTTEHNVLPSCWPQSDVLVIPGMEITSFGRGDWNALGLRQWIDCWGTGLEDGGLATSEGQIRLLQEAGRLGALRNINHPMSGNFAWRYPEMPLSCMDTMEIWNGPIKSTSQPVTEKVLKLWNVLWNDGWRIPGLGGSDNHLLPGESAEEGGPPASIGIPVNYVLAERLTPEEVLRGLRAGRVYVSRGPLLEAEIEAGGREAVFGDDLTEALEAAGNRQVRCAFTVSDAAGADLLIIENGAIVETRPIVGERQTFVLDFDWTDHTYVWRRYEIHDAIGRLLAFTNPLSFGSRSPELSTWQELVDKAGLEIPPRKPK